MSLAGRGDVSCRPGPVILCGAFAVKRLLAAVLRLIVHDDPTGEEGQGAAGLHEGETVEGPEIDHQGLGTGGLQGVGGIGGAEKIASGPEDEIPGCRGFRLWSHPC